MVARRGNAPRSAGCEPAVLLLNYRAKKEWHPHPVMLRGFLVENQACCYCTMRASVSLARVALASDPLGEDRSKSVELQGREKSGAPRTRTLDTIAGATVFKTASSASRTRSVVKWLLPLASHQAHTA